MLLHRSSVVICAMLEHTGSRSRRTCSKNVLILPRKMTEGQNKIMVSKMNDTGTQVRQNQAESRYVSVDKSKKPG